MHGNTQKGNAFAICHEKYFRFKTIVYILNTSKQPWTKNYRKEQRLKPTGSRGHSSDRVGWYVPGPGVLMFLSTGSSPLGGVNGMMWGLGIASAARMWKSVQMRLSDKIRWLGVSDWKETNATLIFINVVVQLSVLCTVFFVPWVSVSA